MNSALNTQDIRKNLRKVLKPVKSKLGKQVRHSPSIFLRGDELSSSPPEGSQVPYSGHFHSSSLDINRSDVSVASSLAPQQPDINAWQYNLLPAGSLSQINLGQTYAGYTPKPTENHTGRPSSPLRHSRKSDDLRELQKLHAQYGSSSTTLPSHKSSRSTLRVPSNGQQLPAQSEGSPAHSPSFKPSHSTLRVSSSGLDLPSPAEGLLTFHPSRSTLRIPSELNLRASFARMSASSSSLTVNSSSSRKPAHCYTHGSRPVHHLPGEEHTTGLPKVSDRGLRSPTPSLRRLKRSGDLRSDSSRDLSKLAREQPIITSNDHKYPSAPSTSRQNHASVHSISHFGSFCILDTYAPGCPVSATSEDLEYNLKMGQQYFLNVQELVGGSMDMVTGTDKDGNDTVHLTLFSPLVSTDDGKVRFLLASLVNVTDFIKDAANEPEINAPASQKDSNDDDSELECNLDDISPMSSPDWDGPPTMSVEHFNLKLEEAHLEEETSFDSFKTKLDDEDLLGGCILPCDSKKNRPTPRSVPDVNASRSSKKPPEHLDLHRKPSPLPNVVESSPASNNSDIWLNLIESETRERNKTPTPGSSASTSLRSRTPQPSPAPTPRLRKSKSSLPSIKVPKPASGSLDSLLSTFMSSLQRLYSSIFLLSLSPLSSAFYEIHHVSPALHASGSYVNGHLNLTASSVLKEMGHRLDGGERFRLEVNWGDDGVKMQCYFVPIWGQRNTAWVCILVDLEEGMLW